MKIAVLFGGCSPEYPVSLQSAFAVIQNLNRKPYELFMIGITKDGRWYHFTGDPEQIRNDSWADNWNELTPVVLSPDRETHGFLEFPRPLGAGSCLKVTVDAVFPVLHGKNGEDGTVQGLIELAGIPLIGCGTLSSALCMDKYRSHQLVQASGIAVPKGFVTEDACRAVGEMQAREMPFPVFVKPVNAGSSFGISRVERREALEPAILHALQYDDQVIIEEAIYGFEVGCAVLGESDLITGEVDEIELAEGFFDYTEKYTLKTSSIHVPARISHKQSEAIKRTAMEIYKVLGCSGFARVDMFLTPEGRIVFNEVNTIPGFTAHSRYPGMMQAAGYSFGTVLDMLIREAVRA